MEQQEVPAGWWDGEADRSLLTGVFKHGTLHFHLGELDYLRVIPFQLLVQTSLTCLLPGYEMYTTMRADCCLCFLERVGRPDDKAIDAEQHTGDAELGDE